MPQPSLSDGGRGAAAGLFLVLVAWPAVLVAPSGDSMSDSVLLAAIRLVDDHTWTLSDEADPKTVFQTEAYDISVHDGRIYGGVGPGAIVAAAPFYLVLRPVLARFGDGVVASRRFLNYYMPNRRALGLPAAGPLKDVYLLQIALAWLLIAPLSASLLVRLHRLLSAHGVGAAPATAVVLSVGLGSMALYYSATYSRQALAYGLAGHAILFLVGKPGAPPPRRGACLLAGALLGAAVPVDYPSAILVALSLVFLLPRLDGPSRLMVLTPLAFVLALTALYHQAAFGSPFATAYRFRFWFTPEVLARQGVDLSAFQSGPTLGVNLPSPGVMLQLCFGPFKGLFVYSPVLLLGLIGHLAGLGTPARRRFHGACLLVFLSYLAFNSTLGTHVSEYGRYFWGGLSVLWGPRYLYAVLPFLACGLVGLDWTRTSTRVLCALLLAVSCVFNVLGTMFSDVVMSTYAFSPELNSPLAYVFGLLLARGPRVPLLDVYGVSRVVQWALLLALVAASAMVCRRLTASSVTHSR